MEADKNCALRRAKQASKQAMVSVTAWVAWYGSGVEGEMQQKWIKVGSGLQMH